MFNLRTLFTSLHLSASPFIYAESPDLEWKREDFIYAELQKGDSREAVLNKLRTGGFAQIYEEKENNLVKCTIRWNGFSYELVCKLIDDSLEYCLIEGTKGWQEFFYDEVLQPQWKNLRDRVQQTYGYDRKCRPFPALESVPMDDLAGYVTDTWELKDRTLVLTVQAFKVKDCCTDQLIEYCGCTLLIQPK